MRQRRSPQRTCVGCRRIASKSKLLRVVRDADGSVRADLTGRAQARGAYVHPDAACIGRAERANGLARALRAEPQAVRAASLMRYVEALRERD